MSPELTAKKHAVLGHVETVRGQLDEVTRLLESDAYCVDVMKQIKAVQCSLESANRITLHNHLETCFSDAMLYGRGQAAIDELIDAVQFTPAFPGPRAQLYGSRGHGVERNTSRLLAATTLSLPGISCQRCKAAIEAVVAPIAGVRAVDVDVSTKTITIHHDNRAPARRLIEAIEEQGYHVAEAPAAGTTTGPGAHDAVQVGPGFVDGDGI